MPALDHSGHMFLPWHNVAHYHSGRELLSLHHVHLALADRRVAARATVLATAYAIHPERFPAGLPLPPARPEAVWINPPEAPGTRGDSQALGNSRRCP